MNQPRQQFAQQRYTSRQVALLLFLICWQPDTQAHSAATNCWYGRRKSETWEAVIQTLLLAAAASHEAGVVYLSCEHSCRAQFEILFCMAIGVGRQRPPIFTAFYTHDNEGTAPGSRLVVSGVFWFWTNWTQEWAGESSSHRVLFAVLALQCLCMKAYLQKCKVLVMAADNPPSTIVWGLLRCRAQLAQGQALNENVDFSSTSLNRFFNILNAPVSNSRISTAVGAYQWLVTAPII